MSHTVPAASLRLSKILKDKLVLLNLNDVTTDRLTYVIKRSRYITCLFVCLSPWIFTSQLLIPCSLYSIISVSNSRCWLSCHMTSCFLVWHGSPGARAGRSCVVLTPDLQSTTGWLRTDLNRKLSWSQAERDDSFNTGSSSAGDLPEKSLSRPLQQLKVCLHSLWTLWYFPAHLSPLLPCLTCSSLCALWALSGASVVQLVLPVSVTKVLHANKLWGGQSRPCADIQKQASTN